MDGSPTSAAALDWAAHEAQARRATLDVVVGWSALRAVFPTRGPIPRSVLLTLQEAAQKVAEQAVSTVDIPELSVETKVLEGGASSVLLECAREADLLVVGRRGLSRAKEVLVGSVSHACIHHSRIPVVIVPH
jgi:nucleotide-binding universal stress UspA family protein